MLPESLQFVSPYCHYYCHCPVTVSVTVSVTATVTLTVSVAMTMTMTRFANLDGSLLYVWGVHVGQVLLVKDNTKVHIVRMLQHLSDLIL